ASFSVPDGDVPILQIAVINTGQITPDDAMPGLIAEYQANVRPDLLRYTEQDRVAMADGSWRMSGIYRLPGDGSDAVNTFIAVYDTYLSVVETRLPDDAQLQDLLQTVLNTVTVNTNAGLSPVPLNRLADAAVSTLEIVQVSTWTTERGVFYVAGNVLNHGTTPVVGMQVRAILNDTSGTGIAEAVDTVMGYAIAPGGAAPFSLRFGQGQPFESTTYTLTLIPGTADFAAAQVMPDNALRWTYEELSAPEGQVYVTVTLENQSDSPVRIPRAVVSSFDTDGRMVAAGFADVPDTILAAGAETSTTVLIAETGGIPETFEVNVQALTCEADCE
ncbi:MAG: hypothetical protein ACPG7F_09225, partial [Aggregatilineales bacterium]